MKWGFPRTLPRVALKIEKWRTHMPALSSLRQSVPVLSGLPLLHRGKVRDTYDLGNNLLLVVATDAISIFDFVLNALVPEKGKILTAMSHFWLTQFEKSGIKTHLVAAGAAIDDYLPRELRGNPDLQSRAMIVLKLKMAPCEFIARGVLIGSGFKDYLATGEVCGHKLPLGLQDGDALPRSIDTPTTKADCGHDEALDAEETRTKYPQETALLFEIYKYVREVSSACGILFADTKLEFGRDEAGVLYLADEVATPDSSRFWELSTWAVGREAEKRKAPPPYDKQLVRQWGIEQGINKLDPLSPDDVAKAQSLSVPPDLIGATTKTYRYIFWRLTDMQLEKYQREVMGMSVADKVRKIAVVFGSESDIPHVRHAVNGTPVAAHVVSCHRNPIELQTFALNGCRGADVVIAAGGKAFALPGVLDAFLHDADHDIPVIGVALGKPGSVSLEAARLSISELPGQPVVMDETRDCVYEGTEGFARAIDRAMYGEFPVKQRAKKPVQFDIDLSALA